LACDFRGVSVNPKQVCLKAKKKAKGAGKIGGRHEEREVDFQLKVSEIYEKRSKNNAHYAGRFRLAFSLESLLEIDQSRNAAYFLRESFIGRSRSDRLAAFSQSARRARGRVRKKSGGEQNTPINGTRY
jgi:hypothetical protein